MSFARDQLRMRTCFVCLSYAQDFYRKEPLVAENEFIRAQPDRSFPPSLAETEHLLPAPFWDGHDSAIRCYWKAWDLAFRNLKRVQAGNGFIAPYVDSAFNDCTGRRICCCCRFRT